MAKIFWIAEKSGDYMEIFGFNNKRKAQEKAMELAPHFSCKYLKLTNAVQPFIKLTFPDLIMEIEPEIIDAAVAMEFKKLMQSIAAGY